MRVLWAEAATRDLDDIESHIATDDPGAAIETVWRIIDAVETSLPDHPGMGRPGRVPGTRELVVPKTSYIVPYLRSGERIVVLRVLHGAMKWPDRF